MPSYNAYIPAPWMLSTVAGSAREWNKRIRTKVQFLVTRVTLGARSNLQALPTPSQTCLQNYFLLPGHCGEPPPWEHEDSKRIYHFVVGQTVHYECIQGYKALQTGSATSICKMICGKKGWTQPQLTCVHEREYHPFPGRLFLSCAHPILFSIWTKVRLLSAMGPWESHLTL